jgi:hypothetical protein
MVARMIGDADERPEACGDSTTKTILGIRTIAGKDFSDDVSIAVKITGMKRAVPNRRMNSRSLWKKSHLRRNFATASVRVRTCSFS